DVGERLQGAIGADAVGAVAALEASEQLALGEQHDRHELQADGEDQDRLDELLGLEEEVEGRGVLDLGRVPNGAVAGGVARIGRLLKGPITRWRARWRGKCSASLALLPAHAATAYLLEREPAVEGHRLEQLP